MKKEEGFSGNISAGSGAGNHFFQRPLYHVLKALFSFFIDVMRSDGFAVCPFGDDAADGSGFQSQHGTKCEKGGIFHFIIRTSDMPEIFQRTLQPFQYIAAEAVIPFLSRPEAVGADGNPRFERDARFLCRFAERKNRIRVGYRRKFDGGVCAGSAVHADRCRIDDYIARVQILLNGTGRADADKCFHAEAGQLLYGKSDAGAAHAGGHDEDRRVFHLGEPCGVIPVRGDEEGISIQCFGKTFHTARVAGEKGVLRAADHAGRKPRVVHDFCGTGVIFHMVLLS